MTVHLETGNFLSADNENHVVYCAYLPDGAPRAVVQVVHGMAEHFARYGEIARFLCENGIAVYGHDHLGHGKTAASPRDYGYFADEDGDKLLVEDVHTLNRLIKRRHPEAPIILLGHSMGSFIARCYLNLYSQAVDAAIISGTSGPNPAVAAGIALCGRIIKSKGPRAMSPLIARMATGSYNKKIKNARTDFDWLTRCEDVVDKYIDDPACGFMFTVSAYRDLFTLLKNANDKSASLSIRKDLPMFLYSGDQDPVGGYGKGFEKAVEQYREGGITTVCSRLYRGGRHEMHNERSRKDVFNDILRFIEDIVLPPLGR